MPRGRRCHFFKGKLLKMESRRDQRASNKQMLTTLIRNKSSARPKNTEPRCAFQTESCLLRGNNIGNRRGVEEIKRG